MAIRDAIVTGSVNAPNLLVDFLSWIQTLAKSSVRHLLSHADVG